MVLNYDLIEDPVESPHERQVRIQCGFRLYEYCESIFEFPSRLQKLFLAFKVSISGSKMVL